MNEIERAIVYFEEAVRESDEIIEDCSPALQTELTEQKEHFVVALASLREQTERGKGCNYCLQTWPDRAAAGVSDIWHGNKLSVGYGVYREIKFCPMCGKRLEVEHE